MLYGVITFGKDVFTTEDLQIKFSEFSENLVPDMKAITHNPSTDPSDAGECNYQIDLPNYAMKYCCIVEALVHKLFALLKSNQ